ncbi:MAG: hypothetical protein KAS62_12520 [Candidatus Delongbacteria bacterium]|nr:hypothetical protein [Candidatus Delongbacteria bacterium]
MKVVLKPVIEKKIIENLKRFEHDEKIKDKYILLKDEFNNLMKFWSEGGLVSIEPID